VADEATDVGRMRAAAAVVLAGAVLALAVTFVPRAASASTRPSRLQSRLAVPTASRAAFQPLRKVLSAAYDLRMVQAREHARRLRIERQLRLRAERRAHARARARERAREAARQAARKAARLRASRQAKAKTLSAAVVQNGYQVVGYLTVEATAYWPDPAWSNGYTSTGVRAGYGSVAVDPSVIPLGTHLFVPGYGQAVADDTGGAIVGDHIDLCFDSAYQADDWGVHYLTVEIERPGG